MPHKKYYICVTPFFPSQDNWRGAYVLDQVKAITRNSNYEVIVFKPGNNDYEIDGIKVYCFRTKELPSYLFYGFFDSYNAKSFVQRVLSLSIDCKKIDFVHCHTCHFAAYGLLLKKRFPTIRVFLQHHDLDPYSIRNGRLAKFKLNTRYRARSARRLINAVDLNICISEPVRDSLLSFPNARIEEIDNDYLYVLKNVKGMKPSRPKAIYVLNNGVDCSVFNTNTDRKVNIDNNSIFRIGCIGNFQLLKDHITLIKAFELLIKKGYNCLRLSLLGTGETRKMCEQYIIDHELSQYVEWPKEVLHDLLPEYYYTLDLFVLPSCYEGFGCVYTEAFACGVPFMGVYGQGAAETIEPAEQVNWLIKPHDYVQLAGLIDKYYQNRNKQNLCKPYDINILVKDFLEFSF